MEGARIGPGRGGVYGAHKGNMTAMQGGRNASGKKPIRDVDPCRMSLDVYRYERTVDCNRNHKTNKNWVRGVCTSGETCLRGEMLVQVDKASLEVGPALEAGILSCIKRVFHCMEIFLVQLGLRCGGLMVMRPLRENVICPHFTLSVLSVEFLKTDHRLLEQVYYMSDFF